jgi:8-amino-7-oxononanoate synthase
MRRYAALEARTKKRAEAGLSRTLRSLDMQTATTGLLDGQRVNVFCSNDYLGLAHHPAVRAAYTGAGAGAARLISGNRPVHAALEAAISEWYGRPATLFSSGYHANLALMGAVLEPNDWVASDALNHASIIDGLRLAKAKRQILAHGDPSGLRADLRMAIVEGLYSMDGDTLAIGDYTGQHWLAVDEAHAVGVLGPEGRGVAAAQGVRPDFLVGTLGKALGVYGAFIVGPSALRAALINQGRSFIYTTGLPEPIAHAALVALALANDERRARLKNRVRRLREGLHQLGVPALGQDHIVPIVLGEQTMSVAQALSAHGHWVVGIRAPTVPAGSERLRITLSAAHTDDQIDGLLDALATVLKETPNVYTA